MNFQEIREKSWSGRNGSALRAVKLYLGDNELQTMSATVVTIRKLKETFRSDNDYEIRTWEAGTKL